MKKRQTLALALTFAFSLGLAGCGGSNDGGGTATGGRLLVVRDDGGNKDIYSLNLYGTVAARLTSGAANETQPRWSPDKTKVAFVTELATRQTVCMMNADGSGIADLTPGENAFNPRWTPSGKIVYAAGEGDGSEIWTMNADGSGKTRLVTDGIGDICPETAPDGGTIAYMKNVSGNHIIYLMNADGTNQRPLLGPGTVAIGSLAFSKDGTKIAYVASEGGNKEIYLIPVNGVTQDNVGTLLKRLTNNATDDFSVNWSPDGSKLLFASMRDGNSELYSMNPDGTGQTRLTNNAVSDVPYGWR